MQMRPLCMWKVKQCGRAAGKFLSSHCFYVHLTLVLAALVAWYHMLSVLIG